MALGSTRLLKEMSTTNIPEGKGRQALTADNLSAICEHCLENVAASTASQTLWASTARYRITLPVTLIIRAGPKHTDRYGHHNTRQLAIMNLHSYNFSYHLQSPLVH
jgi:hypothetical protein